MRANQAGIINVDPDLFYAVMTLHGLGMAGTGFVAGLVGVTYLLARYVRVNLVIAWMMYVLTVLGVVGLVIACLIGRFGPDGICSIRCRFLPMAHGRIGRWGSPCCR